MYSGLLQDRKRLTYVKKLKIAEESVEIMMAPGNVGLGNSFMKMAQYRMPNPKIGRLNLVSSFPERLKLISF